MPKRAATTVLAFNEFPVAYGNFDDQRKSISLIVLHTEAGFKAGTRSLFNTPPSARINKQPSSAHYGVNLDGSVDHYLEEFLVAYHAANYDINQISIGIEHEDGNHPNDPRPDILYQTSAKLVADICQFYSIPPDRDHIKKHSEVSLSGTSCPDSLDVDRIVAMVSGILGVAPSKISTPVAGADKGLLLTDSELNALKVLHEALGTLSLADGHPFGNIEGLARELVSVYPHYMDSQNYIQKVHLVLDDVLQKLHSITS